MAMCQNDKNVLFYHKKSVVPPPVGLFISFCGLMLISFYFTSFYFILPQLCVFGGPLATCSAKTHQLIFLLLRTEAFYTPVVVLGNPLGCWLDIQSNIVLFSSQNILNTI